jgi:transaldolase
MSSSIASLLATGTKLWLDSIDPDLVRSNRAMGASGATSNPIIVADLIGTGRFDAELDRLVREGSDDSKIAWQLTDLLVRDAQQVFLPVWQATRGDDGYVSFELDPLLEDPEPGKGDRSNSPERPGGCFAESGPVAFSPLPHAKRVSEYVRLGREWSAGQPNRMIKVPATPAGLDALEELVAGGVTVNVTLIFSSRQYRQAREAVWRGAQRRKDLAALKSVYSIFVSRLDVYTEKAVPQLSPQAQGMVGILNAKRIWAENQQFWAEHGTPLRQEIVFASTGTKKPSDPPWKYVEAFAGSDIQTNPPATNEAVAKSGRTFTRQVDQLPPAAVVAEIDRLVDGEKLEATLMAEGIAKFANPQKALLATVAKKRAGVGRCAGSVT